MPLVNGQERRSKSRARLSILVYIESHSYCFYIICMCLCLNPWDFDCFLVWWGCLAPYTPRAPLSIYMTDVSALEASTGTSQQGRELLYREKKVIKCSLLYKSDNISNFLEFLQRGAASELEYKILSCEKLCQCHPQTLQKLALKCNHLSCQKHTFLHSSPNLLSLLAIKQTLKAHSEFSIVPRRFLATTELDIRSISSHMFIDHLLIYTPSKNSTFLKPHQFLKTNYTSVLTDWNWSKAQQDSSILSKD